MRCVLAGVASAFALWPLSGAGASAAEPALSYRIEPAGEQPSSLAFSLRNDSSMPVRVLPWNTPLERIDVGNSLAVACNGQPVRYIGRMVKRAAPKPSDFVALAPHASLSADFQLAQGYALPGQGACEIAYRGSIQVSVAGVPGSVTLTPVPQASSMTVFRLPSTSR